MKIFWALLLCVSAFASARSVVNIESFPGKVKVMIDPQMGGTSGAVDVLFVVDDSGSMTEHQKNLAQNVIFLVDQLKNSNADYHAAVITTSMGYSMTGKAGQIVGPVITPQTPNGEQILAKQLLVGNSGDGNEEMFLPVQLALSEPLRSGANVGFYREGADLAVVYVTDGEDVGTTLDPATFAAFLRGLKSGRNISMQALMVRSNDPVSCHRDEEATKPIRLETVIRDFGGQTYSLCDSNFAANMRMIGQSIAPKAGNHLKPGTDLSHVALPSVPDFDSISVVYGSQVLRGGSLKKGWTFDDAKNEILFGADIDWSLQPKGTTIDIEYVPADWK